LPQQVQLLGGRGIKNVYAADGRKLKSEAKQGNEYIKEGTKTYSNNLVFDINDELDYIIFPEGRILYNIDDNTFKYEYHLKDHLGSTRVAFVPSTSGTDVVQENSYYPFGAPIADLSWSPKSTNRYLREGKEYVSDFDWNKYDYSARYYDPYIARFLNTDPMVENYYGISPYMFVAGNPINLIDPTGMMLDWIENKETKEVEWRPEVTKESETPEGYNYIGKSYKGLEVLEYRKVEYQPTFGSKPFGVEITLGYKGEDGKYQWVQTINTNDPMDSRGSSYVDKESGRKDNTSYYYAPGDNSFLNKNGYDATFYDKPYRYATKNTDWTAELSLVKQATIKTPDLSVRFDKDISVITISYGFYDINKKTYMYPLKVVKNPTDFHIKSIK
jgi:RHS repeat-associated protein